MRRFALLIGAIAFAGLLLWGLSDRSTSAEEPGKNATAENTVDFDKQIRPLIEKHCLECHGPEMQEAGFRLDRKADALAGGDSGQSIVPGDTEGSKLFEYVSGANPDVVMPPDGKLPDDQVKLFQRWIEQGAEWPDDAKSAGRAGSDHWSFQPIRRPDVPKVPADYRRFVRNDIDAFVLARLAEEKIAPSPEADRETLIRRLSLDLLGLLPSPEEVDRFVNDTSPDAYADLVDRLLASPHFGERWGRHWLDLARYADSDGYEKDRARPFAWRWRDWVIDSFNRDQPFDEFTIEQLAGDLLPDATLQQKIATGFHRNTLLNKEGGVDQEEFRVKATVDRVNTTGAVWLGLTVGCAQCHSHKYDPLTQREYYQLFDFFNSVDDVDLPAPTHEDRARYAAEKKRYDEKLKRLQQELADERTGAFQQRFSDWLKTAGQRDVSWRTLTAKSLTSSKGVTFVRQEDGSYLVGGANPEKATYEFTVEQPADDATAFKLDVLPDDHLSAKGPGRTAHGNFVLSRFRCFVTRRGQPETELKFARADATFHQAAGTKDPFHPRLALVEGGDPKRGWAISPQFGKANSAVFELAEPLQSEEPVRLRIVLAQNYGSQHTIGRFRLSVTSAAPPVSVQAAPPQIVELLKSNPETWSKAQRKKVGDYYATLDSELIEKQQAVDALRKKAPVLTEQKAQTLARRSQPRTTHIMIRGNFLDKGAEVAAATPAVLNPMKTDENKAVPARLAFARWLVGVENPLTRRVAVNRIWQHLFGNGIVRTTEDFGTRGELPSHPALLDWLADEFVNVGWSRKQLIRLIVSSHTYRQSSAIRPDVDRADPLNRLLARQNRFRLEAEIVRDLFLDASGLLATEVGGPSIHPPLPNGVRELGYANSVKWPESKGNDRYRRGCYIFFQRTVPYPMLMTFDSPDSNVTCTRRERSNTPLQSLTLLNDPVFFECSQKLGEMMAAQANGKQDAARISRLVRTCLSRPPTQKEETILAGLLADYRRLAEGSAEEKERRSWIGLARVVMNLDEFVTRE